MIIQITWKADTNQPPKSEKCKRKSGSSEVIEFLKQYVDEQKSKEERMKIWVYSETLSKK